jgi:hypothetical protein
VHRLLAEQRQYGGANVAAAGTPAAAVLSRLERPAEAAPAWAPASVEAAMALAVTASLEAAVSLTVVSPLVSPAVAGLVDVVVSHVCLLHIRTLVCARDISVTYHNLSRIP